MNDAYAKRQALESPDTFASVIHAIIIQQYGEAAYDWDALTIAMEVKQDFDADISPQALDRFCALQVVMANDSFFKRVDAFMGICNTLTEGSPFADMFNQVTTEELAWGIAEVSLNREILPISYGVRKYIQVTLKNDGYPEGNYPSILEEFMTESAPKSSDIRKGLADLANRDNINVFIDGQLHDLVHQFNKIPSLRSVDDIILRRDMNEFVGSVLKS